MPHLNFQPLSSATVGGCWKSKPLAVVEALTDYLGSCYDLSWPSDMTSTGCSNPTQPYREGGFRIPDTLIKPCVSWTNFTSINEDWCLLYNASEIQSKVLLPFLFLLLKTACTHCAVSFCGSSCSAVKRLHALPRAYVTFVIVAKSCDCGMWNIAGQPLWEIPLL